MACSVNGCVGLERCEAGDVRLESLTRSTDCEPALFGRDLTAEFHYFAYGALVVTLNGVID